MHPAYYPTDPEAPGPASPHELVRHLHGYEGVLPEAVRRPLVAAGAPLVPALIALVEDALADDQTDLGWAPLHAIDLLGVLGDARPSPRCSAASTVRTISICASSTPRRRYARSACSP